MATPKAKAPETFEATCPTCGMTGDVGPDALEVRCARCGTVVRLTDTTVPPGTPVPAASPVAGMRPPAPSAAKQAEVIVPPNRIGLALAVGLAGPLLVGIAFGAANDALDEPFPDTGYVATWLMATVVLGGAAAFALWPAMGDKAMPRGLWALFSAVPMFILALAAGQAYDDDGVAWLIFGLPVLVIYLLAVGITAAVVGNRGGGAGAAAVLIPGVGLCVGLAAAAAFFLMTLEQQAADAREAHEAPAWGMLLVVGVLLAMAAHRRRAL